jgi:hypothetical protein
LAKRSPGVFPVPRRRGAAPHNQGIVKMRNLTINEIEFICGAASLAQPIDHPQSEIRKEVNDGAQLLNNFGSWLGGAIYDATH